jgi:hypothetical protein
MDETRVEKKIFVFSFSRKFSWKYIFVFAKIDENSENFRESFRENAKSVIFTTHFTFLITFCQSFYFKRPTLVNRIQSDVPVPKYSKSIMFPLVASIFVRNFSRKCLHFRENFCIFEKIFEKISRKWNFRTGLMATEF